MAVQGTQRKESYRPRPDPATLPVLPRITRLIVERNQREQISYLIWRLEVLVSDTVGKEQGKKLGLNLRAFYAKAGYEDMVRHIEHMMDTYLRSVVVTIQSIYDEKGK